MGMQPDVTKLVVIGLIIRERIAQYAYEGNIHPWAVQMFF